MIILLFILIQSICFGQIDEIKEFARGLKANCPTNQTALLKHAFRETHRIYLKHYKAYSELEDIFKSGDFDCLSGTLFFSALLNNLNIEYKVYETNYHIFLVAMTSKGEVLIETTDKNNGLVNNKNEIAERINQYKLNAGGSPSMYLSKLSIFNEVNQSQMIGLVLFNKAISKFLQTDYISCFNFLKESREIYNSPRIGEFSKVLIRHVSTSEMPLGQRDELISKIKSLIEDHMSFASR